MSYLSQSGPLVWLVLAFGIVALVAAARYVTRRSQRDSSLALGATVTCGIVALLATVAGFQKSVGGLRGRGRLGTTEGTRQHEGQRSHDEDF